MPNTSQSQQWFERSSKVIPGGVNSPVRAFGSVGGQARVIERGAGSRLWDVDGNEYVDLVTGPMLEACAPYSKSIDVFCETGAFTVAQSRRVLEAGIARGLAPRVHASQLGPGEGVRLAVELGAASIDHGTYLTDADIDALAGSDTKKPAV